MSIDPKNSPGFHLEREAVLEDFNTAAVRTQRGALRLHGAAHAAQRDAREVRTATAEKKRVRQSSGPTATALPMSNPPSDPKIRTA